MFLLFSAGKQTIFSLMALCAYVDHKEALVLS